MEDIRSAIGHMLLRIREAHGRYVQLISENPLCLLIVVPGYLWAIGFSVILAASGADALVQGGFEKYGALIVTIIVMGLIVGIILCIHLLYISVRSFLAPPQHSAVRNPVFRVIQLIATTVILFAAAHYYIALFSDGPAYHGLQAPSPRYDWEWRNWADRLMFIPSSDTLLDCLYFSTITMATVGYGDIYPLTAAAKIATILEVFSSFTLIVVVLGSVTGAARSAKPSLPSNDISEP